jgi:hypothetical protein
MPVEGHFQSFSKDKLFTTLKCNRLFHCVAVAKAMVEKVDGALVPIKW